MPRDRFQRTGYSQTLNLLSFLFAQRVGHPGAGGMSRRLRPRLAALSQLAAFQATTGRFWAIPEAEKSILQRG